MTSRFSLFRTAHRAPSAMRFSRMLWSVIQTFARVSSSNSATTLKWCSLKCHSYLSESKLDNEIQVHLGEWVGVQVETIMYGGPDLAGVNCHLMYVPPPTDPSDFVQRQVSLGQKRFALRRSHVVHPPGTFGMVNFTALQLIRPSAPRVRRRKLDGTRCRPCSREQNSFANSLPYSLTNGIAFDDW